MRTLIAMVATLAVACSGACSGSGHRNGPYGAQAARLGESLGVLGWNMAVSNLRWDADHVLIDVDAARTDPAAPHALSAPALYTYSPRDRIPGTVSAWRADGTHAGVWSTHE